ncbi:AraC family transcriptional regulator [Elizabethkingia meningoseptica]|uniref:AraC family transcriptional regulator n=1 Tax=Elizabethkingia meningoseptica TaxID=238 RepID=A0A1V3TZY5_ELIME|nr:MULTISPECIES: AraC family transcriptional regulator [Elizabethkingia]AQX13170.1 transcriptional regulator [Elizabethkingia meningoseptica]EJK5328883.1 helix-turn-helix domain-containing protein [Elizabethkingia meningoseptica]MBG0514791.1 helix-turn-helix domain-containing protein [Elizabethkingia meningoseptica]MDE5431235.1 AraC family transcriptional regulator [Elizabethkingia meningoseptica]MDE5433627.1 AraC family transcriptional regulator [Elizabethkingia meningoseptica]
MKVSFERIIPNEKSSFRTLHNNSPISEFKWEYHYHPEIELVCVTSGSGTRHVGYHKSNYTNGDLVLIGSNIPHSGFGLNSVDPHEEIVLQFKEEILQFPQQELEARSIQELLERSQYGILYSTDTKKALLPKLQQMLECEGYKRYLLLLEILFELSTCEDYELLNKEIMPYTIISKNKTRLENIFTYVEHHYQEEIYIQEVAKLANLTLPAFCNFFKKATQITFTEFVNRFRISKACLLMTQDKTISECSYSCGFNNVTYFNRMFKKYTGKTPSEFIKDYAGNKVNL